MLYSEAKERENRFIIALKIVFPFLLLVITLFYSFKLFYHDVANFILIVLLIPVYVYYIFYLIYNGFRKTLIDVTTKTFIRKEIFSQIENSTDKKNTIIVLLHVNNIADINERYGANNSDLLLKNLIQRLDKFLHQHHFKNIPIGRYGGGHFLFLIKHSKKELTHLLTIFSKELKNVGINNIEAKIEFSMLESDYDTNVSNVVEQLFMMLEESKKSDFKLLNIKPDVFEHIVQKAITNNEIFFKYQPSLALATQNIAIIEVLTKIDSKEHGLLSKAQIERIVNYMGFEKEFDEKVFSTLLDNISLHVDKKLLFSVEISPVTLRNNSFKSYLLTLFRQKKIDPHHFILEISEKNSYADMYRFKEIVMSYKEAGFKVALGNFGGNNCSVEYIKHLPIDIIKFDIEFTKKIEDEKYAKILASYMELAKTLQIQTMVKFVDKESLFEKIKAFSPDYIQGFYISKPKDRETLYEIR